MNTLLLTAAGLENLPNLSRPLAFVGVFDDSRARLQAMQVYSRMFNAFCDEFDFECDWCSFEQLNQTRAAEEAATMAAKADMVAFAVANAGELPKHMKLWIEMWLAKRTNNECALIAIAGVERKQGIATAFQTYLEGIAHQVG